MDLREVFIPERSRFPNQETTLGAPAMLTTPQCVIHENVERTTVRGLVAIQKADGAGLTYAPLGNYSSVLLTPSNGWWAMRIGRTDETVNIENTSGKHPALHCLNGIPANVELIPCGVWRNPGTEDSMVGVVQTAGTCTVLNTGGTEIAPRQKVMLLPIPYIDFKSKDETKHKLLRIDSTFTGFYKIKDGGVGPLNDLYYPMTMPLDENLCAQQATGIVSKIVKSVSLAAIETLTTKFMVRYKKAMIPIPTDGRRVAEPPYTRVRSFLVSFMDEFNSIKQPCTVHLALFAYCKFVQYLMSVVMQDPASNLAVTPFSKIPLLCDRIIATLQTNPPGIRNAQERIAMITSLKNNFRVLESMVGSYISHTFQWAHKTFLLDKVAFRDDDRQLLQTFDSVSLLALVNHDATLRRYVVGTALSRSTAGRPFDIDLRIGF